jgi:hypothetical protein
MCSLYELLPNKLPPTCGFAAPTNVMLCCYSSQFKDRSQDLTPDLETHMQPFETDSQHSAVIRGKFTQSAIHPQYHPHYPQIHRPHCSHSPLIGVSNHFVIPN